MRRFLAVVAIALTLAACEARAEIDVKDDGSGTFGFSFFVEKEYLALLGSIAGGLGGSGGGDPFKEMRKELEDAPVDFDVEEYTEKGGRGLRGKTPFKDAADLRRTIGALSEDSTDSPFGESFQNFTLERRGGGWHFEATTKTPDLGGGSSGGSSPGGFAPDFDPEQIAKLLTVQFRVSLPGRSVGTTADTTEAKGSSTTFIWKPSLTSGKPIKLVATTGEGGSSFPVIPVAAAVGGAAALGAAMLVMANKRKRALAVPGAAPVVIPGADPAQLPQPTSMGTTPDAAGTMTPDPFGGADTRPPPPPPPPSSPPTAPE